MRDRIVGVASILIAVHVANQVIRELKPELDRLGSNKLNEKP